MRKSSLKILHVAATIGNVGDDASHIGLKRILDNFFNEYELTPINIRKSYSTYNGNDRLVFDQSFVDYINTYDLCIFGGGAFLDHPINGSLNGPTIDFPVACVEKITSQVLFSSMGCRPKSASDEAKANIKFYLDSILNNPNCEILLRNDGSLNYLKSIGFSNNKVLEILDHGFFLDPTDVEFCDQFNKKYACINVVHDQQGFFGNARDIPEQKYYEIVSIYITRLCNMGFEKIFLVPHIHQDLLAISHVMNLLDANIVSDKVVVHQLRQGVDSARATFGLYYGSSLNLGTRFHMNVCSLAFGRPTIPFAITQRIQELYSSLGAGTEIYDKVTDIDAHIDRTLTNTTGAVSETINEKKQNTMAIYERLLRKL